MYLFHAGDELSSTLGGVETCVPGSTFPSVNEKDEMTCTSLPCHEKEAQLG